jgi:hypothetical protein
MKEQLTGFWSYVKFFFFFSVLEKVKTNPCFLGDKLQNNDIVW